jgi:hypothetical protein
MVRAHRIVVAILSVTALCMLTGCPDTRTSNQGGGSVLTVAAKVQANPSDPPIGELNPDEWQIVADNLPLLAQMTGLPIPQNVTLPTLTDEQAQDLTDFLTEAGVTNLSQLTVLAQEVLAGEVEIPASLLELADSVQAQILGASGT